MWYFLMKVLPKAGTVLANEAAGAFVSCWIDFREKDGAEHLAKYYLDEEGWESRRDSRGRLGRTWDLRKQS